ncbi:MAG: extracellular solute-binding protein [Oscillospiraceae bacterium]|nr:extracellular solute-binding protein [Oscillospiraceae bacterium]
MKLRKNLPALLLAFVLLLSILTACGEKPEEEPSGTTAPTSTVEASGEDTIGASIDLRSTADPSNPATDPLGRYEETVVFTTARPMDVGANFPSGMDTLNNPIVTAVQEKLNVEMDLQWQSADYGTKLDMCIVSDDLPDVFWVDNYMTYQELLENDMLEPLTNAFRNCAGEYMRDCYSSFGGEIFEPYISDGELYALPSTYNGYQHSLLWIRKDWLDALGLEAPTTREELEEVARQFMQKDPGGNGAGNTIGIAVQANPLGSSGTAFGLDPIMASFGAYPQQWIFDENGKVVNGSITPEAKEGLAYLAYLYAEGIIDPQFTTRDYNDALSMISTGKCGICFYPWNLPYAATDFLINNPTGEWIVLEAPVNDAGEFTYSEIRSDFGALCVRKGYEHPEVVIKVANVEFDMWRGFDAEGYEAVQPILEAGTTWTAVMMTGHFNLEYDDAVIRIGELTARYIEKGVTPADTTEYNKQMIESAKRYFDNPTVEDTEGWIMYLSRYIASNAHQNGKEIDVAYHYSTESMALFWASLLKIENQYYMETIIGTSSIENFDDFVEQWKSLGGEDITAEVQAIVDGSN